jgi:hypothetical protein
MSSQEWSHHPAGFHIDGEKIATLREVRALVDLPPFLRQPVKTQNPSKGELSHGIVEKDVHQRVQAGGVSSGWGRATHFRAMENSAGPKAGLRNWSARSASKPWRSIF